PTPEPTPTPTPKPTPTPTPTPTPSPTTLLVDNFESYPTAAPPPSPWLVASGSWDVLSDQTKVAHTVTQGTLVTTVAGSASWTDYKVTARVKAPISGFGKVVARYQDPNYMYVCGIENGTTLFLGKYYGGAWYNLNSSGFNYSATTWYYVSLTVLGDQLTCTATESGTGRTQTVTTTASYFTAGPAGFFGSPGAEFDDLNVTTV
ncbi:MAG: hypothetical protein ABI838_04530, partial [Chloroflexota bacterium]